MTFDGLFTDASNRVARAAGSPSAFLICCVIVVVWAACGPFFGFSNTWQLIINTGTTIVTFPMVFLIQNRDGAAIQAKLDELIRASLAKFLHGNRTFQAGRARSFASSVSSGRRQPL